MTYLQYEFVKRGDEFMLVEEIFPFAIFDSVTTEFAI